MEFRVRNIPEDLYKALQHVAISQGISVNASVIEAIEQYTEKHASDTESTVKILFQKAPWKEEEKDE